MPSTEPYVDHDRPPKGSPRLFADVEAVRGSSSPILVRPSKLTEAQKRRYRLVVTVKALREADSPMPFRMIGVTLGISERHAIRIWKAIKLMKLRQARV